MNPGWQWAETAGVPVLRVNHLEALGGVKALFTSRHGGVSPRPWNSLNLSHSVGDDPLNVAENRRRVVEGLDLPLEHTAVAGLVHGDAVGRVDGPIPRKGPGGPYGDPSGLVPEVDALITATPGIALLVTTADCTPIWLYDPDRRAAGLVHAGWRGTALRAVERAVQQMAAQFGSRPERLLAAVGPAIGPCCYEVDQPVWAALGPAGERWLRPGARPGRWQLDLWSANQEQLVAAGLRPEAVSVAGLCTSCQVDRFYSHRAEGGRTGRQAAVVVLV